MFASMKYQEVSQIVIKRPSGLFRERGGVPKHLVAEPAGDADNHSAVIAGHVAHLGSLSEKHPTTRRTTRLSLPKR